ncbi:MAG TPA: riboflavin synthase [Phycisphaerae bacterium]|nr:riboflavin synthase [Phycisphaerae bacterium]
MFTGLIEAIGEVLQAERRGGRLRLSVDLGRAADGIKVGDSINLSGACQTVAHVEGRRAEFNAVAETLARTTLDRWKRGTHINIERSLRPGDRLGGHFVAGHVDGTGRVVENAGRAGGWWLRIEAPGELFPEIAPKGSIAVDGVSLTVVEVAPPVFSIALIPTTLRETALGHLKPGDRVNLETDLLAKYVRRALGSQAGAEPSDERLREALERAGFLD